MAKRPRPAARQAPARDLPDFTRLPERVPANQLRTTHDVDPGPDPLGGRDTETEFMLRNAGF